MDTKSKKIAFETENPITWKHSLVMGVQLPDGRILTYGTGTRAPNSLWEDEFSFEAMPGNNAVDMLFFGECENPSLDEIFAADIDNRDIGLSLLTIEEVNEKFYSNDIPEISESVWKETGCGHYSCYARWDGEEYVACEDWEKGAVHVELFEYKAKVAA